MTPIDTTTAAQLLILVAAIVGILKFAVPGGPHQNDYVRLLSAVVGTGIFIAWIVGKARPDLALIIAAGEEGFIAGAGATVAAKIVHLIQDGYAAPSIAIAGSSFVPLEDGEKVRAAAASELRPASTSPAAPDAPIPASTASLPTSAEPTAATT